MELYLVCEHKEFADNLDSDFKVRQYLTKELAKASVSRIVIERPAKSIRVTIHTARPGIVIGKKGEDVEKLRKVVADIAGVPARSTSPKFVSLNWTQNWLLTASLLSWNVALCSVVL